MNTHALKNNGQGLKKLLLIAVTQFQPRFSDAFLKSKRQTPKRPLTQYACPNPMHPNAKTP